MSRTKIYQFDIGGKCFVVQAEAQGVARFMLRMRQQGGGTPFRIGYLTGANRTWVLERVGGADGERHDSAKSACRAALQWALAQPDAKHMTH